MNSFKIVLAALAIFAAGVVTGTWSNRFGTLRSMTPARFTSDGPRPRLSPSPARDPRPMPPGWARVEALRDLTAQLELTDQQRGRIQRLFEDGRERIRNQWAPIAPRVQQELRRLRSEISAELTPEQRRIVDERLHQSLSDRGANPRDPAAARVFLNRDRPDRPNRREDPPEIPRPEPAP